MRNYGGNPYAGYDSSAQPFLYRGDLPKGINAMARVVVLRSSGAPVAVTLELLRAQRRHNRIDHRVAQCRTHCFLRGNAGFELGDLFLQSMP